MTYSVLGGTLNHGVADLVATQKRFYVSCSRNERQSCSHQQWVNLLGMTIGKQRDWKDIFDTKRLAILAELYTFESVKCEIF